MSHAYSGLCLGGPNAGQRQTNTHYVVRVAALRAPPAISFDAPLVPGKIADVGRGEYHYTELPDAASGSNIGLWVFNPRPGRELLDAIRLLIVYYEQQHQAKDAEVRPSRG